jgi:hypothetical protein
MANSAYARLGTAAKTPDWITCCPPYRPGNGVRRKAVPEIVPPPAPQVIHEEENANHRAAGMP